MTVAAKPRMVVKAGMGIMIMQTATRERRDLIIIAHRVANSLLLKPENNHPKESNPGSKNKNNSSPDKESSRPDKESNNSPGRGSNRNKAIDNNGTTTVDPLATITPDLKGKDQLKMINRLNNNNFCVKSIILLFVASTLVACDKQTVYHSFQSIPTEGWQRKDTLFFNVEVPDSFTCYKLSLEVRNRNDYPYQNINLSISTIGVDTHSLPADTFQLILANKNGRWKGTGWGSLYQLEFAAGGIQIGKPGSYQFKIAHTLADEVLYGVNDIGIKLKR